MALLKLFPAGTHLPAMKAMSATPAVTEGIVHETAQNWLGALLPLDAKTVPLVPARFLRLHGLAQASQMTVEDF